MAEPPNLPSAWINDSLRFDNLAPAVDDLAIAVNTLAPLGITGWTVFTPALTAVTSSPTIGTGAVRSGRWFRFGRAIYADLVLQFGSSGMAVGSGAYRVSLPTPVATTSQTNTFVLGVGHLHDFSDAGPGAYKHVTFYSDTSMPTTTAQMILDSAPTNLTDIVTHASPWTWAASDRIIAHLCYEAAT